MIWRHTKSIYPLYFRMHIVLFLNTPVTLLEIRNEHLFIKAYFLFILSLFNKMLVSFVLVVTHSHFKLTVLIFKRIEVTAGNQTIVPF